MKISVSLPPEDVELLDAYARSAGLPSRSAALQHAIRLLRELDLERDYDAAWSEWSGTGERAAWSRAIADGLVDAPR